MPIKVRWPLSNLISIGNNILAGPEQGINTISLRPCTFITEPFRYDMVGIETRKQTRKLFLKNIAKR